MDATQWCSATLDQQYANPKKCEPDSKRHQLLTSRPVINAVIDPAVPDHALDATAFSAESRYGHGERSTSPTFRKPGFQTDATRSAAWTSQHGDWLYAAVLTECWIFLEGLQGQARPSLRCRGALAVFTSSMRSQLKLRYSCRMASSSCIKAPSTHTHTHIKHEKLISSDWAAPKGGIASIFWLCF